MAKVIGRVILSGTDLGVPHLLVSVYDAKAQGVDATAKTPSAPRAEPPPARSEDESRWTRLGSVVTDDRGGFSLDYEEKGHSRDPKGGPDLILVISAPLGSGAGSEPVRIATAARRNAANIESFIIPVTAKHLEAAGIRPPGQEDIEELIEQRRGTAKRQDLLRAESQRLFVERLEARRKFERIADSKFDMFLSALSSVPAERRHITGGRYVPQGASVLAANQAMIKSGIEGRINGAVAVGVAALSDAQAAQFKDAKGEFGTLASSSALESFLRPKQLGLGPSLSRAVSPSFLCHEGPVDPCVKILAASDNEPEPLPTPEEPPQGEPKAPLTADIPLLIENLVQQMTPPESATVFSVHTRAGIEQVQQGVNGFTLHSGPADAPALHDFHHLQIAFEHVWQELFDDDVVAKGKDLYTDLVELGVDPNEYLEPKIVLKLPKTSAKKASSAAASEPPASVINAFDITPEQWVALSPAYSQALEDLALELLAAEKIMQDDVDTYKAGNEQWLLGRRERIRGLRRRGEHMISYAASKLNPSQKAAELHHILQDLEKSMKEPYRFSIYAADRFDRSVNFGVVATYRQKWEPVSYQVGELVKTVPLAPKEVRRFTKKVAIRQSRAEKEVENHLQARKIENAETARAETVIVQKAQNKTNFQLSAQGGVNIGIASAKGSTAFTQSAATESQEVKKEFREAVFRATEDYKQERTLEINVSTSEETALEESGEISNPNDEITVTYLFYELQRRYRISEHIHRVSPVVLIAQEFPKPNEIDEDWIVAHDWILRRVILDDSFTPAMNYLASKVVGDEFALAELYRNLQQQRRVVDETKNEVIAIHEQAGRRYAALQKSIERRAEAISENEGESFFEGGMEKLFGSTDASPEAMRVRENAAKDAFERAAKEEKDMQGRLDRETTALNALTETYTKNLSEHLNRKAQIDRLRVHIKANIMYYMQAIWSHEPPDQRYFRLHEVQVPKLNGKTSFKFEVDQDEIPMPPDWKTPYKLTVKCKLDSDLEFQTLEEVADLDNLLGFKGNYMMFPLKKSNALTDFMMIPYLDTVIGIRDPDPLGNWTLTDFLKYVCCLVHTLSKPQFDKLLPGLQAAYQRLVNTPGADGEEIVVPTDSLFIEALPGVHPILEDFKLFHRVLDVKKVQADVRAAEFENLRMAARLLAGEREDPTIEKKVVIEGGKSVVVPPDDV